MVTTRVWAKEPLHNPNKQIIALSNPATPPRLQRPQRLRCPDDRLSAGSLRANSIKVHIQNAYFLIEWFIFGLATYRACNEEIRTGRGPYQRGVGRKRRVPDAGGGRGCVRVVRYQP